MRAISSAAKRAAPALGMRAQDLRQYLVFDRLLARVFRIRDCPFVLKGGTRMLAFIPQARATVDIDLEASGCGLLEAVELLRIAVAQDIGDRLRFEFFDSRPGGGDQQANMAVVRLRFDLVATGERVKIDLAVHDRQRAAVTVGVPAFRVPLARPVAESDYVMVAVEQQIADKVAAMMERRHVGGDGRSSRAKDLVDLALIALHLSCDARLLREAIARQIAERGLDEFMAVDASAAIRSGYPVAARKASTLSLDWKEAERLVNRLIEPALDGTVMTGSWDPLRGEWG
ncbi:MAG: hypothetical protein JWR01_594 [Subtercola sp.]|nr:hypothetical protein [Subtercola sp.]